MRSSARGGRVTNDIGIRLKPDHVVLGTRLHIRIKARRYVEEVHAVLTLRLLVR